MSTEISGIESETSESPAKDNVAGKSSTNGERPGRKGGVLAFFAFVFALTALAGTGWMWWQDQTSRGLEEQRLFTEIARLDNSDSKLSLNLQQLRDEMGMLAEDESGAEFAALQQRLQADRAKLERVEKTLEEQTSLARSLQNTSDSLHGRMLAAETSLSGMSVRELDAGGELDIAEVDYLLRLANERLKLFSDPQAADRALEVADMNLAALDNPMYLGVRQEITAARRELALVKVPDYLEISGRLDAIKRDIAVLPFQQGDTAAAVSAAGEPDGWWAKVKAVFSSLVTVRRSTEEENQRVSLQDKEYIRQSVWLQLEVAQLALMRRDPSIFQAALGRVKETIPAWFDHSDSRYQAAMLAIDELAATEIQSTLPDITAPWSKLRLLKGVRPAAAPAPAPAPQREEKQEPSPPAEEGEAG